VRDLHSSDRSHVCRRESCFLERRCARAERTAVVEPGAGGSRARVREVPRTADERRGGPQPPPPDLHPQATSSPVKHAVGSTATATMPSSCRPQPAAVTRPAARFAQGRQSAYATPSPRRTIATPYADNRLASRPPRSVRGGWRALPSAQPPARPRNSLRLRPSRPQRMTQAGNFRQPISARGRADGQQVDRPRVRTARWGGRAPAVSAPPLRRPPAQPARWRNATRTAQFPGPARGTHDRRGLARRPGKVAWNASRRVLPVADDTLAADAAAPSRPCGANQSPRTPPSFAPPPRRRKAAKSWPSTQVRPVAARITLVTAKESCS